MDHSELLDEFINKELAENSSIDVKWEFLMSEISSGSLKFITVVEKLQSILTNENVTTRERGVDFLSKIIQHVPENLFNESEIIVITKFLCNCLKEHHSFLPATLAALVATIKMQYITEENIFLILKQLFSNVNCNTQLQGDRFKIYSLLDKVILNHFETVKKMGPEFIFDLISFIDGETDPKCLLLIFKFLPLVIKNCNLGQFTDDLFELLSCYFPVDFNAAAKDDTLITREDLSDNLMSCLTANNSFCQLCLPVISEKLSSNLKLAKLDSYKLLEICCKSLKSNSLEIYLNEIWECLIKDVLPGNDEEIFNSGLSALACIVQSLQNGDPNNEIFLKFLDNIVMTMSLKSISIEDNLFQSAMKVFIAVSSSSRSATCKVLNFLKLFYQSSDETSNMKLTILLAAFLPFLNCCLKHQLGISQNSELIVEYEQLINLYVRSTKSINYDVRKLAYEGVTIILSDCSEKSLETLCETFADNIRIKNDIKLSEEFASAIWRLAELHPEMFKKYLLSKENISIQDVTPQTGNFLLALSIVADLPHFIDFFTTVILEYITSSVHFALGLNGLLCACGFAKKKNSIQFFKEIQEKHNILKFLIDWWIKDVHLEPNSLFALSESLAIITRNQDLKEQQKTVDYVVSKLICTKILMKSNDYSVTSSEMLSTDYSTEMTSSRVVVSEAILGSVLPQVNIPYILPFSSLLLSLAADSSEPSIHTSSSRLLASFINKSEENLAFDMFHQSLQFITKELKESSEVSRKHNCGSLFTWVIKGIVLKGESMLEESLRNWFSFLGRGDIGWVLAENFHKVLEDDDLYLNWESHCNVRILYRQRIFEYFPMLLEIFKTSVDPIRSNYLLVLACLLKGVPAHIFQEKISGVVVVLIECLKSDNSQVVATSLDVTEKLLESREKTLTDYIGSFVPKFLDLAASKESMRIRLKALKCLFLYGFYPTFTLLPLKNKVTRNLEPCLDDKKRLVRKEAVRARCRWFLIGAPGEDIVQPTPSSR